jgi:hypothetical protein
MERLWQLRLSSRNRLPLFPTEASQRRAVRRLAEVARGRLVLFGLVHEHGHPVVLCDDQQIGLLKRSIRVALGALASQPIEPIWSEAVNGRGHMRALLRYVLEQPTHHGLSDHPALWSGSCFLDLIGARKIDCLSLRVDEALPDLRLGELQRIVGLPPRPLSPATDDQVRVLGATRLTRAAAAAFALDPSDPRRRADAVAARRVVVLLARRAGLSWTEIRRALPVSDATLFRMAVDPSPGEAFENATRVRLALEEIVRATSIIG